MRWVFAAMLCLLPALGVAKEATPAAEDPVLEQRLLRLAKELRCLVCQNESLADSHADLAADLPWPERRDLVLSHGERASAALVAAHFRDRGLAAMRRRSDDARTKMARNDPDGDGAGRRGAPRRRW